MVNQAFKRMYEALQEMEQQINRGESERDERFKDLEAGMREIVSKVNGLAKRLGIDQNG